MTVTVLMLVPRYAKYLDSINIMISAYNIEISQYLTTVSPVSPDVNYQFLPEL